MFDVPLAAGVKVTLHEAEVPVPYREQVGELNEPEVPVCVKLTIPNGAMLPEPDVSVTVAVHVAACPARTEVLHVITVDVPLLLAVKTLTSQVAQCLASP